VVALVALQRLRTLGEVVAANPFLAFTAQFNPISAGGFAALQLLVTLNQDKVNILDDVISQLPDELIKQEAFGRALQKIMLKMADTDHAGKVQLFAELLRKGSEKGLINFFDDFKELAELVDELHPNEIHFLTIMDQCSDFDKALQAVEPDLPEDVKAKFRTVPEDEGFTADIGDQKRWLKKRKVIWEWAKQEIKRELRIDDDVVTILVNRVARLGCFASEAPSTFGGSADDNDRVVRLTPLFYELKKYVQTREGEFFGE
jgi:hypothetical protein